MSASAFRSQVIKELYIPIVTKILANTQNLALEGLIKAVMTPQAIPGISTGASQSFHTFDLGNSLVEVYGASEFPKGYAVQMIGPTLATDLYSALSGVLNVSFSSPKEAINALNTIRDAVDNANAALQQGYKEPVPTGVIRGCLFDNATDCNELLFENGLPAVHHDGSFPGPVLFIVYDVVSGQISIGNYLFFPKPA